ncbi:MAG: TIGR04211 family SH3 domain-containing protein [Candidatus Vesicomyosocius endoextente]|uniref:TIGR04211 family SH3 domain-containing protein n=1 Tax=Candidatus Vesicomyosocius endoextente TaxID=2738853 RepID=A0A853GCL2_9GAMM|nr:TIGR04211 family SH3 domain-containing protein [Candidatus Vesicomyosocius endoextente]
MNLIKYLLLTPILFSTLISNVNAKSFVYITDQVDIPMREDKSFNNNIIRSFSSGEKLYILQTTKDGWTKVKHKESIGWVISRYLSNNPPAIVKLDKLKKKYDSNQLLSKKQGKRNIELEKQVKILKNQNIKFFIQNNKSKAEKQHIENIYKNTLKLEHSNEKFSTKILQLKAEIQILKNNNIDTQNYSSRNWFITGGLVLFFGVIIGLILSHFVNRRRY